MENKIIATSRDLRHYAVAQRRCFSRRYSLASQQLRQCVCRLRKLGQIVLSKRQRFTEFQRTGQCAKMFSAKMGERTARRLMEDQRLQSRISQPFKKTLIPGNVALWQHAKAQML